MAFNHLPSHFVILASGFQPILRFLKMYPDEFDQQQFPSVFLD